MRRFITRRILIAVGVVFLVGLAIFGLISQPKEDAPTDSQILESGVVPTPAFTFSQTHLEEGYESENYLIVKTEETGKYDIVVLGSPFEKYRSEAEEAFLKKLNIAESEACSLNVVVGTVQFANPDEAGRDFPLSFCE